MACLWWLLIAICLFIKLDYSQCEELRTKEHIDPLSGARWISVDIPSSNNFPPQPFGAMQETPEERAQRPTHFEPLAENEHLPRQFDARKQWPQCPSIREIRDQSSCGSCWAFGAVEAMSDRLCIHSNATYRKSISALDLLSCCDECGLGCYGGFPARAWDYWMRRGLVTGGSKEHPNGCRSYPFPQCVHHGGGKGTPCPKQVCVTPECVHQCDTSGVTYTSDLTKGNSSYNVPLFEKFIMKEILRRGPVEAAFDMYEDFLSYRSGVYYHVSGRYLGGHAVRLLGWGEEAGTPYWLLANSWNEQWGEGGFFRILRGRSECGIEDRINAGLPDLSTIVHK